MGLCRPVHDGNISQHAIRTTSRTSFYLLYCCTLPVFPYWLPDGNTSQHAIRTSFYISLYLTFMFFNVFTLLLYFATVSILTTGWQHQPTRNSRDFTNLSLYCTLCSSRYLRYYYTWPNSLLYCTYFTLHTLLLYCTTPSIPPTWWQHRPPRNPHVLSYLSRLDFHALHFTDFTPLLLHYFTTHLLSQPL